MKQDDDESEMFPDDLAHYDDPAFNATVDSEFGATDQDNSNSSSTNHNINDNQQQSPQDSDQDQDQSQHDQYSRNFQKFEKQSMIFLMFL